jgi:hypothetical protein
MASGTNLSPKPSAKRTSAKHAKLAEQRPRLQQAEHQATLQRRTEIGREPTNHEKIARNEVQSERTLKAKSRLQQQRPQQRRMPKKESRRFKYLNILISWEQARTTGILSKRNPYSSKCMIIKVGV